MKIKILVAHHKNGYFYKDNIHDPIQVGKEISKCDLEILSDNVGQNISRLNHLYCELTATYWAWKNVSADYVGICHYRRYFYHKKFLYSNIKNNFIFCFNKIRSILSKKYKGTFFKNQFNVKNENKTKIISKFSKWITRHVIDSKTDIYALKPVIHFNNNNFNFFSSLGADYIVQLKNIVKEDHNEFYDSLNLTLNSDKLHFANMIIMKNEYFSEYSEFVFDVLNKHLQLYSNNVENYLRIPGYMAELLTSTFILHKQLNGFNIKYLESVFIEN